MIESKKICIIYGGPSGEHDVSIKSAKNVLSSLKKEQYPGLEIYTLIEVFLDKEINFKIIDKEIKLNEESFFNYLKKEKVRYIIPMLHGEYGEDGKIQKKIESIGIKYFGSDSVTSHSAMSKGIANKIFTENNITIPKSLNIDKDNYLDDIKKTLSFPVIVKPMFGGSSVGLFKFKEYQDYVKYVNNFFNQESNQGAQLLLQEFVKGREFTCGVIDYKDSTFPLSVTEVILNTDTIFDYDTKYTAGACKEVTPADISTELSSEIKSLALKCHSLLGCKDISRTDILLDFKTNKLYVLETNTLPGMTETSFIPAQLRESNISIKDFFESKFES